MSSEIIFRLLRSVGGHDSQWLYIGCDDCYIQTNYRENTRKCEAPHRKKTAWLVCGVCGPCQVGWFLSRLAEDVWSVADVYCDQGILGLSNQWRYLRSYVGNITTNLQPTHQSGITFVSAAAAAAARYNICHGKTRLERGKAGKGVSCSKFHFLYHFCWRTSQ